MVTPFAPDGSVDYALAARLAVHLVEQGSDGLVVCGTTGESPTLTWEEEYRLFQVVCEAIAPQAQVIAGTGSNCTQEATAATNKVAKLGVSGTLQVVPYYNRPPQAGLYQHFVAIAQAAPELPMMLYNIPGRTGQALEPETVAKLARIDNIVAIKEASGRLDVVNQIRALTPPDFAIYAGDDAICLPLLALGGRGVVSVASHLVGPQLKTMIETFLQGQVDAAQAIHAQLLPLFQALFCTTNPIPLKAALQMQGWAVGSPRSPLCDLPDELRDRLTAVLQDLHLL